MGKLKEVDTDNFLEEWNENPRRFQKDLDPFGWFIIVFVLHFKTFISHYLFLFFILLLSSTRT